MTDLFSNGFESGDFSAWTGTAGNPSVVTTAPHHGTYHAKLRQSAWVSDVIRKDFTTASKVSVRTYFRINTLPPSSVVINCLYGRTTGNILRWSLIYEESGGTCRFRLRDEVAGVDIGTYNINLDTNLYYSLEVLWEAGTQLRFYLNGTERIGSAITSSGDIGRIMLVQEASAATIDYSYFDCIVVADAYIGPEASSTLQTVTDSLTLADALLRDKTLMISDNLGIADSTVGRDKSLLVTSDLVSLIDLARANKTFSLDDSLSFVDYFSTPSRVLQALDSAGLSDTALIQKMLVINETVSLAEVVESGVGGAKKTRLFLILGDLAIQLTGD